ncbi:hypothetical protein BDR04DRAFT_1105660 [Suillus decipiens]|nr:hypothetical protein BDR04DRAFT_1105660 [Suillus decipiens]
MEVKPCLGLQCHRVSAFYFFKTKRHVSVGHCTLCFAGNILFSPIKVNTVTNIDRYLGVLSDRCRTLPQQTIKTVKMRCPMGCPGD